MQFGAGGGYTFSSLNHADIPRLTCFVIQHQNQLLHHHYWFTICDLQIWHLGIVFQAEEICEMAHEGKSLFFLFACLFDSLLLSKQVN